MSLWLATLVATLFLPSLGIADTNAVVWGETAGGLVLGIRVDTNQFAFHCWVKNAEPEPLTYNDFYFGYHEDVQLEVLEMGRWIPYYPTLYPYFPILSSAGPISGAKVELAPNAVMSQTWSRRRAISPERLLSREKALSEAARDDTFLVDLVRSLPTNVLSQSSLEIRVAQRFGTEIYRGGGILRSPACTLEGSLLKSMLLLRRAEQSHAADGSQPIRPLTIPPSSAAGPHR